ncbi:MAG: hypothetical protein EXX96DRAFT_539148 [Benjaminiella poitrasii]|nr:MAG: hypothetical protein EXX96DRAFT_539148 [Benjaminiella poitrasii]
MTSPMDDFRMAQCFATSVVPIISYQAAARLCDRTVKLTIENHCADGPKNALAIVPRPIIGPLGNPYVITNIHIPMRIPIPHHLLHMVRRGGAEKCSNGRASHCDRPFHKTGSAAKNDKLETKFFCTHHGLAVNKEKFQDKSPDEVSQATASDTSSVLSGDEVMEDISFGCKYKNNIKSLVKKRRSNTVTFKNIKTPISINNMNLLDLCDTSSQFSILYVRATNSFSNKVENDKSKDGTLKFWNNDAEITYIGITWEDVY